MIDAPDYSETDFIDDILEQYFEKYASDYSILTVSELDGFLTAIACAPTELLPSRWLAAVWGGEDQVPTWYDQQEIEEFHAALLTAYKRVLEEFVEGEFSPRIYDENGNFMAVDEWCDGFLRGVALYGALSADDQAFLDQHLQVVRLFVTQEGVDDLLALSPQQVQQKAEEIEPAVRELHDHFFNRQVIAAHTPFISLEQPVGRNDPCPCGSGKKFKKCCLH